MRKIDRKIIVKAIALAVVVIVIGVVIRILLLPSFKFSADSVEIEAGKTFDAESYITKVKNIDINEMAIII